MGRNLQGALDAAHQGAWQSSGRDQASAVVVVWSRRALSGRARASFESSPHHSLAMRSSVSDGVRAGGQVQSARRAQTKVLLQRIRPCSKKASRRRAASWMASSAAKLAR
jgi:hypothetical protein